MEGRMMLDPRVEARQGGLLAFEEVERRLVDALVLWRRMPDRERGWQAVKAYWPDIMRHPGRAVIGGEHDEQPLDPQPRPLRLSRAEVAEMEEVSEWMRFVPERDRRLVALALACLADGEARVPWMRLKRAMGVAFGADGLRKRYGAALTAICHGLNGAEKRG